MFLMQESIQFQVEFLYQWLVSNNIDVCILDEIAAAVESQEVQNMLDISLAQMFLSRTIQQHNSPRKVNFSSLHFDDNDDEDEL